MILRSYQEGDAVAVLSLFSQCFGKSMQESFWRWRFQDNPIKQAFIQLAWEDNTLVAHYAVSPVLVVVKGNDYITSLSMTTMTHPQYRGLKLFPKLANHVYDKIAEANHLMVWGFPNRRSHRIFVRDLYWSDIYEIPTMQLKVDCTADNQKFDSETDNQFELDYIDSIYSSSELIHVKKNKRYLRWRYAENPVNNYTNLVLSNGQAVSSFCVVKKYLNSLDIVDFEASSFEEGESLIAQAISFACENKLDLINCWAPRHHFIHGLCEKFGFVNKDPITYLGFRQLSDFNHINVSENYSGWYIQMGDSDVY